MVETRKDLERRVAEELISAGYRIVQQAAEGESRADLVAQRGKRLCVIELKSASEGRADRLVPLFAQAILQANALANTLRKPATPVAIVGAPHIGGSVLRQLEKFAAQFAGDTTVAVLDSAGFLFIQGDGLESLRGKVIPRIERLDGTVRRSSRATTPHVHLFSDLNQWMLKILLAPQLPREWLRAPREPLTNASALAQAAGVSLMTAFRFVRQLQIEGFLEDAPPLRLVRIEDLLSRWQSFNASMPPDIPMRWLLPGDSELQLTETVRLLGNQTNDSGQITRPAACLGLFAAAKNLGLGHVHGAISHLLVDELDISRLEECGLVPTKAGGRPDVHVRVPPARESVFRAAVTHGNVEVSDVIQIWLDVSAHPSRGREQADLIYRRAFSPFLKKAAR